MLAKRADLPAKPAGTREADMADEVTAARPAECGTAIPPAAAPHAAEWLVRAVDSQANLEVG